MSADHVHRCRYCDEALATEESVLAKSAERSASMAATVHGHNVKLVEERKTLRAALATSQADVTRVAAELAEEKAAHALTREAMEVCITGENALAAELAESVRALAVSQGERDESERLRVKAMGFLDAANKLSARRASERDALRGDLERARGELEAVRAELQNHALLPVLQRRIRAFLAPPTPTASPEPDRASPEVPKEET